MFRQIIQLTLLSLLVVIISSCEKAVSVSEAYAEWKVKNEAFYDDAKSSGKYDELRIPANRGGGTILYKVLTSGDPTTQRPYYTSTVAVHYKGWMVDNSVFDKSYYGDAVSTEDVPVQFKVSEVIKGWTEALMQMRVGDKWEIIIPWKQAYGEPGSDKIPPYSTLIFEVELVDIPIL